MRDDIGVRVVLSRTRRGWSQKELSEKTGLSQKTLSLLEKGHSQRLYAETVVRLAKALGVSTDWLLGLETESRQ
jgi:transcriptional regulator with XRE-family HTH domain